MYFDALLYQCLIMLCYDNVILYDHRFETPFRSIPKELNCSNNDNNTQPDVYELCTIVFSQHTHTKNVGCWRMSVCISKTQQRQRQQHAACEWIVYKCLCDCMSSILFLCLFLIVQAHVHRHNTIEYVYCIHNALIGLCAVVVGATA